MLSCVEGGTEKGVRMVVDGDDKEFPVNVVKQKIKAKASSIIDRYRS